MRLQQWQLDCMPALSAQWLMRGRDEMGIDGLPLRAPARAGHGA